MKTPQKQSGIKVRKRGRWAPERCTTNGAWHRSWTFSFESPRGMYKFRSVESEPTYTLILIVHLELHQKKCYYLQTMIVERCFKNG